MLGEVRRGIDFTSRFPFFVANYDQNLAVLNQYILPYIKYEKVEKCKITNYFPNAACVYMNDGSSFALAADTDGIDILYCVNCDVDINITPENPRKKFWFEFAKSSKVFYPTIYKHSNSIEPYIKAWNGTLNGRLGLKTHNKYGCSKNSVNFAFCTKIIELNGWKIPKDYPW